MIAKLLRGVLAVSLAFAGHAAEPAAAPRERQPAQGSAKEVAADWQRHLDVPLVDGWLEIFGMALTQPARPAETWGQKFAAFEAVIVQSTGGPRVPIFLSPKLAATRLPAVEEKSRIGLHLSGVPIAEALKYLANLAGLEVRITPDGILLDLAATK